MIKYIISFVVVFTTHGTERTWYVVHCFFSYTRIKPNVSTINTAAPDFLFGRVNLQIKKRYTYRIRSIDIVGKLNINVALGQRLSCPPPRSTSTRL